MQKGYASNNYVYVFLHYIRLKYTTLLTLKPLSSILMLGATYLYKQFTLQLFVNWTIVIMEAHALSRRTK